jgi:hypothetical protein
VYLQGLVDFIYECIRSLRKQRAANAEKLNDKFATTAKFQMTYGGLSLFYGGLESLVRSPPSPPTPSLHVGPPPR